MKVIDDENSAQQCMRKVNLATAIEASRLQQLQLCTILPVWATNSSSKSPTNDEYLKRKHKEQWILEELVKKVYVKNVKIERILEFFVIGSEKMIMDPQFC